MITFYLGYLFATREKTENNADSITVAAPNGSIQNSLSQIETRNIVGSRDAKSEQNYGDFYFKVLPDNKTEIMLRIDSAPLSIKASVEKPIPSELNIALARRTAEGLDYNLEIIGKMTFDDASNGVRRGKFSSVLKPDGQGAIERPALASIERILLLPTKAEDDNIYVNKNPDLPQKVRERPSAYFWVVI